MKKLLLLLSALLSLGSACVAQSTTVTATITDSDSFTWNNGTYTISFVPNPNGPSNPSAYTWTGGALTPIISGSMNGSGALSQSVPTTAAISPIGSSWRFNICPNATSGCFNYTTTTIGGSMNLTSILSALAKGPRFPDLATAYGYGTIEVTPTPVVGVFFYNTTSDTCGQFNGSTWSSCSGGGGPATGLTPNGSAAQFWQMSSASTQGWTNPTSVYVDSAPFNAKCDGVTDDAVALQAAFDSGASDIYLPADIDDSNHQCNSSALLTVHANQRIHGNDDVLFYTGSSSGTFIQCESNGDMNEFHGLYLQTNTTATNVTMIRCDLTMFDYVFITPPNTSGSMALVSVEGFLNHVSTTGKTILYDSATALSSSFALLTVSQNANAAGSQTVNLLGLGVGGAGASAISQLTIASNNGNHNCPGVVLDGYTFGGPSHTFSPPGNIIIDSSCTSPEAEFSPLYVRAVAVSNLLNTDPIVNNLGTSNYVVNGTVTVDTDSGANESMIPAIGNPINGDYKVIQPRVAFYEQKQGAITSGFYYSAAGTPLPSCNQVTAQQTLNVSDASSPTYLGSYTSGGSVKVKVYCNAAIGTAGSGTTGTWVTE